MPAELETMGGARFIPPTTMTMTLSIIHYPHPTLKYRSRPLVRVDQRLKDLAAEMLDLMYENEGVGLAANQVDLPLRMFVANETGERGSGEELVLINPEVERPKGSESQQEGCLSVPGVYGQVKRAKSIRLHAYDLMGNEINRDLDGFLARVVLHEIDHLDGNMFFDRMSDASRRELDPLLDDFCTDFESKRSTGSIPDDQSLAEARQRWEVDYTGLKVTA